MTEQPPSCSKDTRLYIQYLNLERSKNITLLPVLCFETYEHKSCVESNKVPLFLPPFISNSFARRLFKVIRIGMHECSLPSIFCLKENENNSSFFMCLSASSTGQLLLICFFQLIKARLTCPTQLARLPHPAHRSP